jgi:hypothetical protein
MSTNKELLKEGIDELFIRDKISKEVKREALEFINNITNSHGFTINYNDFRQNASSEITFDNLNRTATFIADGSTNGALITNLIRLKDIILKSIQTKGTDQNVTYEFSYNLVNWNAIKSYDINEQIRDNFYLKVNIINSNTITGLVFIYNNL